MGPLVMASQLATGLGVLAGAVLVKSAMEEKADPNMAAGWQPPRCATCNGTGRIACVCSRWSDGDHGCRTCSGSGGMPCGSCRGKGKGRPLPIRAVSMRSNNRSFPH